MVKRIIITIITVLPFLADAQSFYAIRRPRNLGVYGGTGTALYKGELVNPKQLGKVRYNLVVGAEYFFSRRFTAKSELTWFRIAGSDKDANDDRVTRNLSFFSNCQELSLAGTFYVLQEPRRFYQRSSVNGYVFLGAGLLHFNPKTEYQGDKHRLQPLQTEGTKYSLYQFVVPFGVGVKIMVDPLHNLIIEGGYRTTFTDHLDDISIRRYPDPATLSSPLAVALSNRRSEINIDLPYSVGVRGNPKQNDGYFIMNVKFQYYLPMQIGPNREANQYYKKKRKGINLPFKKNR
jgi:Domain of unknown function (DUF6089)